jgi:type IV pilus assembly protein PilX
MNRRACNLPFNIRPGEQGAALVVSLIILVIMTMLGLAAIRGVTQQERMAGNSQSRGVSFQATEKALRDIEEKVESIHPRITQTSGTCAAVSTVMTCGIPSTSADPRWRDSGFTDWEDWTAVGTGSLAITPEYFVEYLGNTYSCNPNDSAAPINCLRYRITVRTGGGASGRAQVMLQSIYATNP